MYIYCRGGPMDGKYITVTYLPLVKTFPIKGLPLWVTSKYELQHVGSTPFYQYRGQR